MCLRCSRHVHEGCAGLRRADKGRLWLCDDCLKCVEVIKTRFDASGVRETKLSFDATDGELVEMWIETELVPLKLLSHDQKRARQQRAAQRARA